MARLLLPARLVAWKRLLSDRNLLVVWREGPFAPFSQLDGYESHVLPKVPGLVYAAFMLDVFSRRSQAGKCRPN